MDDRIDTLAGHLETRRIANIGLYDGQIRVIGKKAAVP